MAAVEPPMFGVPEDPRFTGRGFLARYPGTCTRCDHAIEVGERIEENEVSGDTETYRHVRCAL